jgi:DUF4097 and DUF4098 domain-containing protein YvlB
MTSRLARPVLASVLVAGMAFNAGCIVIGGNNWAPPLKAKHTSTVAHVAGKPLSIESVNGSIDVTTGGDAISIEAELRGSTQERLDQIKVQNERLADGTLRIWVDWPGGRHENNEGASFIVKVPDARGFKGKTSNGSVKAAGLKGDADVRTSNGSVKIADQGGMVTVDTSNASIDIIKPGGVVKADTSNGKVTVTDAPAAVTVDTSNASVDVALAANCAGPVNIDSSNGSIKLFVGQAFAGEMILDTSNGSITLPATATVLSKSRNRATVRFGSEAEAKSSRLDTSNASIKVEAR